MFRLHANPHDDAGAVRSHSDKGPGYCHMIGHRSNTCVLDHVTEILLQIETLIKIRGYLMM